MIRKPLQRVADGAAIDDSGADSAHSVPEIEAVDRLGIARSDPAQPDQNRADAQHEPGTDFIHQVSFERHKPRFQCDEQSERPLDSYQRDVQMRLYRFGEKRPGILQVRDRHHCDDAGD